MRKGISIGVLCLLAFAGMAAAQTSETQNAPTESASWSIMDNETLTNNWFGFGEELEKYGLEIGASITNVYQVPLRTHNGQTNKRDNAYSMSYDLEATLDLETLAKIPGASFYVAAEGGWHDGIGPHCIGSFADVNADATGNARIGLTEFYYSQELFDGFLKFKIGKIDVGGGYECQNCSAAFDGNRYAEDETCQFLNGALTGNPTIDSPDNGLGAIVQIQPVDWAYIAFGASDASADGRDITFDTAVNGHDEFFAISEIGIAPNFDGVQGVYRAGIWYNNLDYGTLINNSLDNENYGFYLSFDQELIKENNEDDQGLAGFFRFGMTDDDVYLFSEFWSFGLQYKGLFPSRDKDTFGIGIASSEVTEELDGYSWGIFPEVVDIESSETIIEAYYNIMITDYIQLAPDIQFINNAASLDIQAVVAGLRLQVTF